MQRQLLELAATPDALPYLIREENIALFERQKVYSRQEIMSRYEILLENYCKVISIEAHTMLDLANQEILPAVMKYAGRVGRDGADKLRLVKDLDLSFEQKLLTRLTALINGIGEKTGELDRAARELEQAGDSLARARFCRDAVFRRMQELRALVDDAETIVDKQAWPFPGYGELLITK